MPLYIKSPVTSQCNLIATSVPSDQSTHIALPGISKGKDAGVEVSPLPRFAMVRCTPLQVRKAQEMSLKSRDPNAPASPRMFPTPLKVVQGQEVNVLDSKHALIETKISPSDLKLMVSEVQKVVADSTVHSSMIQVPEAKGSAESAMADAKGSPESQIPNANRSLLQSSGQPRGLSAQNLAQPDEIPKTRPFRATSARTVNEKEGPNVSDYGRGFKVSNQRYHPLNHGFLNQRLHPSNPFANNNDPLQEAVNLLQASAHALFRKMDLHPETLKQILRWQSSASKIPGEYESIQNLFISDTNKNSDKISDQRSFTAAPGLSSLQLNSGTSLNPRRPSTSSYFPNTTSLPCRRAYKYMGSDSETQLKVMTSTPKFLLNIRESLSNISLVPMVSSTCRSSPHSSESSHSEIAESDISDLKVDLKVKVPDKALEEKSTKLHSRQSLPVLRSKMKKIMRTLSDMNAVPEVIDIFVDNLPPIVKISTRHLQRLKKASRLSTTNHSHTTMNSDTLEIGQSSPTDKQGSSNRKTDITKGPTRIPKVSTLAYSKVDLTRPKFGITEDLSRISARWLQGSANVLTKSSMPINPGQVGSNSKAANKSKSKKVL